MEGEEVTYGSLFAGIGGFDLGFERAGMKCVWQVEIDPFCRKVLAKHWPDVPRWDDVSTFTGEGFERPDVICGGFPCQDISLAGRRDGLAGERSGLWWEFARIVRVVRPRYVVVENVPGLLVSGDDDEQAAIGCVLGELARIGYDAEWTSIPASAFGSSQQRFRVFIVAYPQGHGDGFRVLPARWRAEGEGTGHASRDAVGVDANNVGSGCEELHIPSVPTGPGFDHRLPDADDPDAKRGKRRQGAAKVRNEGGKRRASSELDRRDSPFVGTGWWSAEPPLVRMVHGVPRGLVRPAIHALGNSVVPQVAEWIGQRLMESKS